MLGSRRVRTLTVSATALAGLLAPLLVTGAGPAQAAAVNYGKVVFVDDGDTIDVDVAGDGTGRPVRVRYIGIQSMELSRYSQTLSKLRGECWGVDAAVNLHKLVNKKRVALTSRSASSHSSVNPAPSAASPSSRAGAGSTPARCRSLPAWCCPT